MFLLKIQRDLCHPNSFGSFEKRAPGKNRGNVDGLSRLLLKGQDKMKKEMPTEVLSSFSFFFTGSSG